MSVYLVAFQIDEDNMENQNYDDFAEALEEYDGYCQIFDNLWFVCSDGSADDVHEDLVQHLYDGDFILITEMGDDYRGFLPESAVDWLNENIWRLCGSGGMADALASGASGGNPVEVQVLSAAPNLNSSGRWACWTNTKSLKIF